MAHPPRSKPPLRSSSGPPSPCITPSTETFVVVVSFMVFLSLVALLSDPTERTHRSHREPGHGSRTHTRHPLGGDRLVRIFGEVAHHLPTDRGGPNRAATARPVARTSGLALRVFRSPFAGSSPLWLRDGVGGPTIGRTARRGAPAPPMRSILGSEPPHQTQSEEGRSPRRPRSCHEPQVLWRGSPSNSGGLWASPMLMGRGLSLSPTVLFIGFIFWAWLLGGPGAFLAAPLTIFLVLMLDTFPETRWIASVMGAGPPDPDSPAPQEEVVETTGLTPKSES